MSVGFNPAYGINPYLINLLSNASLQGTLTPEGIATQQQAEEQKQLDQLAQQSAQAAQAQQQAGQQYQQAAAAPPPEVSPLEQFVNTLGGNIASTIAQDPVYRQRSQQRIQGQQNDLLKARQDNLTALSSIYEQRARAAEHLGDLQTAEKYRVSHERMAAALQKLRDQESTQQAIATQKAAEGKLTDLESLRQKNRIELENLRAKNAASAAAAKTNAAGAPDEDLYKSLITTTSRGNKVLDTSDMLPKDRQVAMKWAAGQGLLALSKNGMSKLADIETARQNLKEMRDIIPLLPKNAKERAMGGSLLVQAKGLAQIDPLIKAFRTSRVKAIQQLKALAGGPGSGLRINQAEIKAATESDIPDLGNDTQETATQKLDNVEKMLDNTERPVINRDWRKGAQPTAPQATDADREYVKKLLGKK